MKDGKFYRREGDHWVAVDNCGGEWFVEEFRRMKDAIGWLTDPEGRTGDDLPCDPKAILAVIRIPDLTR